MHPFLQFPQLFFLAPLFVPLLLRTVAACVFVYLAYTMHKRRVEIGNTRLPIIGAAGEMVGWVGATTFTLIALALFFGYYTQFVAIIAAIGALKGIIFAKRYASILPLARGTYFLLMIICISLILSGAGALGMDQLL